MVSEAVSNVDLYKSALRKDFKRLKIPWRASFKTSVLGKPLFRKPEYP
jgi:hypothetical protein